ncbi:hypothetical protein M1O57_03705 [Dehalococcoidia bacterium]|nr:hypothetical protein [Dehalococcoidia bacterium]
MDQESMALARQRVIAYATRRQPQPLPTRNEWPQLERVYHDYSRPIPEFTEEQIQEVLHQVEKYSPEDELNYGACGYDSCRRKAAAILSGMAEATMCIPYMRTRAESLTNLVMDVTPNAVLILDNTLHVQDISLTAERMFNCHRVAVRGKPLSELIPIVDDFLSVRDTGKPLLNKIVRLRDDLTVDQSIVPVGGENLMVTILCCRFFMGARPIWWSITPHHWIRDNEVVDLPVTERVIAGKIIRESRFALKDGDYMVMISDGYIHAGVGGSIAWGGDGKTSLWRCGAG